MIKAVLTGHTHGLGAAIAADLMARGVAVHGLARGRADALAGRYPDLLSEDAIDLADSAGLLGWLATGALAGYARGADSLLLINNAGVVTPVGPLHEQDPLAVAQAVAVNVSGPLVLAAALARLGKPLRILHVSSGAGRNAYPGWGVYCATKAALDHHARAVALDGTAGVRICSLAPGVIDTAMQSQIRATPAENFPLRERFVAMHRDGELSAPAEAAARLVDYLLGPEFGERPVDDARA